MCSLYSQQRKDESDTIVSEIIDCDTKSLPDVIPSTVLENLSSNSTKCDITANLTAVDMDLSTDTAESSSEVTLEKIVSDMDLSEEGENQSIQEDETRSVEEKRAEHYLRNETSQNIESSTDADLGTDESNAHVDTENVSNNNANESDTSIQNLSLELTNPDSSQSEKPLSESVPVSDSGNANSCDENQVHIHLDDTSDFDTFQYWRTPIPQVDIDLDSLKEDTPPVSSEDQLSVSSDLNAALSNSMSDLTVCDTQQSSVLVNENTLAGLEAISSGDTSETTMTVIDGMVQGR